MTNVSNVLQEQARHAQGHRDDRPEKLPRYKWAPTRNIFRIRPVVHKVTELDKQRPSVDFLTEQVWASVAVGQEIVLPCVPAFVYRRKATDTTPSRFVVGHDGKNCPAWAAWMADGKPSDDIPKLEWVANVIDMLNPERGTMIVALKSEWRGPRTMTRPPMLCNYGIEHFWLGFVPGSQPAVGTLPPLGEVIGDEIWATPTDTTGQMLGGRNIVVVKKPDIAFGKDCATIDLSAQPAPIVVTSAQESPPVQASLFGEIIDLLADPGLYPGFSGDGNHKTPAAAAFADAAKASAPAQPAPQPTGGVSQPLPSTPATPPVSEGVDMRDAPGGPSGGSGMGGVPVSQPAPTGGMGGMGGIPAAPAEPTVGSVVTFVDENITMKGRVARFDGETAVLDLNPNDQPSPEATNKVSVFLRSYSQALIPKSGCTVIGS